QPHPHQAKGRQHDDENARVGKLQRFADPQPRPQPGRRCHIHILGTKPGFIDRQPELAPQHHHRGETNRRRQG
ncbi:MAG: hypothetical protein RMK91_12600, partial [Pseudanabaenaceae cyanobacterium SKYGB_i_bin29]|nr:hypothetical protein [Pseudanabaenaceae cyanobacterium SKYGB_i_bin29]